MNEDSLANAEEVYHEMRDNRKEEVSLIPLYEMIERKDINEELLNKIKFFITNNNINPYEYKISSETGLFYNTKNDEVLEVRKNPETGQYEIVKVSQVMYNDEEMQQNLDNSEKLKDRELPIKKVRRRIPPKDIPGQAAFVKTSILITICILMSCVLSTIILLLK